MPSMLVSRPESFLVYGLNSHLIRRQSDQQGQAPDSNLRSNTTVLLAAVVGGILGLFILASLFVVLRNKTTPIDPSEEPSPPYMYIFRRRRQAPEDVAPLPLYMEYANPSQTVLQSAPRNGETGDAMPDEPTESESSDGSPPLTRAPSIVPIPGYDTTIEPSIRAPSPPPYAADEISIPPAAYH